MVKVDRRSVIVVRSQIGELQYVRTGQLTEFDHTGFVCRVTTCSSRIHRGRAIHNYTSLNCQQTR